MDLLLIGLLLGFVLGRVTGAAGRRPLGNQAFLVLSAAGLFTFLLVEQAQDVVVHDLPRWEFALLVSAGVVAWGTALARRWSTR